MLFKVGDFVVLKGNMEHKRLFPMKYRDYGPLLLQVVETLKQTCAAGVEQNLYTCRVYTADGHTTPANFNEIELEAAPAEPVPAFEDR